MDEWGECHAGGGARQMAASTRACRMPVPRAHAIRQPFTSKRLSVHRVPLARNHLVSSYEYVKRAIHATLNEPFTQ
eukprot:2219928-Prymnesium_polylepis.1